MNPLAYLIGVPWLALIVTRAAVHGWWKEYRNGR